MMQHVDATLIQRGNLALNSKGKKPFKTSGARGEIRTLTPVKAGDFELPKYPTLSRGVATLKRTVKNFVSPSLGPILTKKTTQMFGSSLCLAAGILTFCTVQTEAADLGPSYDSGECRILWGAFPCSTGPYHINTGGDGPDMGITPADPGKPSSKRPSPTPETPNDEPEDDINEEEDC